MYKGCTTTEYRNQKEEEKQARKIDKENQELREDNNKSRLSLENSVRANNVLDEALKILEGLEDVDHLVDRNVIEHNTQHGEKRKDVKRKNDVKHTESPRRFVTFSSADKKAVTHLSDERGEKTKVKQ